MSKVGVMICGHGSRDMNAVEEFDAVARGLRERLPQYQIESGFLEVCHSHHSRRSRQAA